MNKKITQEQMKNARTSGNYQNIWTTREKCVFCDLKKKYILHEENGIVLTISLYPYIDGHLMAIPQRHVRSPKQLTEKEWLTIKKYNYIAKKIIRKAHGYKAMWTLIREGGVKAGMSVTEHLHVHFIPFDKKDLCQWNYRELKYTPIENTEKYRQLASQFQKFNKKFEDKYKSNQLFAVVCDLIIMNKKNQILFTKHKNKYKLNPDFLTLPGGHIDNANSTLENELQREIKEEINLKINKKNVNLLNSQISKIKFKGSSQYLNKNLAFKETLIWNVYYYDLEINSKQVCPQNDCESIVWIDIKKIINDKRISKQTKKIIQKFSKVKNQ